MFPCADDELEIRTLVSFHGKSNVQYILDITPLNEVRAFRALQYSALASYNLYARPVATGRSRCT